MHFPCLLRVGSELFLVGRKTGRLAVLDLKSQTITYQSDAGLAGGARLHLNLADGCIYTSARGRLVRIHPTTRQQETLGTYPGLGEFLAFSGPYIYGFSGAHLVRFRL